MWRNILQASVSVVPIAQLTRALDFMTVAHVWISVPEEWFLGNFRIFLRALSFSNLNVSKLLAFQFPLLTIQYITYSYFHFAFISFNWKEIIWLATGVSFRCSVARREGLCSVTGTRRLRSDKGPWVRDLLPHPDNSRSQKINRNCKLRKVYDYLKRTKH